MNKSALNILLSSLILIPAQAIFFNNMVLFHVALPIVFIYTIITLPVSYSAVAAMTVGFASGLAVDILSDTAGMNALACTLIAFLRLPFFHLYVPGDIELNDQRPSLSNIGAAAFMKYAFTMIFFYYLVLFGIELVQVFNFKLFVLRVIAGSIFSFIIIFAIAAVAVPKREKKI